MCIGNVSMAVGPADRETGTSAGRAGAARGCRYLGGVGASALVARRAAELRRRDRCACAGRGAGQRMVPGAAEEVLPGLRPVCCMRPFMTGGRPARAVAFRSAGRRGSRPPWRVAGTLARARICSLLEGRLRNSNPFALVCGWRVRLDLPFGGWRRVEHCSARCGRGRRSGMLAGASALLREGAIGRSGCGRSGYGRALPPAGPAPRSPHLPWQMETAGDGTTGVPVSAVDRAVRSDPRLPECGGSATCALPMGRTERGCSSILSWRALPAARVP